jgi:hypothetical protein
VIAGRLRALHIIKTEDNMAAIPTVQIDRDGQKVIINESDFDSKTMTLFGEKPAAKPKAAPKKTRKAKAES